MNSDDNTPPEGHEENNHSWPAPGSFSETAHPSAPHQDARRAEEEQTEQFGTVSDQNPGQGAAGQSPSPQNQYMAPSYPAASYGQAGQYGQGSAQDQGGQYGPGGTAPTGYGQGGYTGPQPYASQGAHVHYAAAGGGAPAYGPLAPDARPAPEKQPTRPARTWVMVAAVAVLAAVLASGGTALALNQQDAGSSDALVQVPSDPANVASNADGSPNWQSVANKVRPSVVAINVATDRGKGAGSGIIIDADNGYVLTNNHVVDGARKIAVALVDGRIYDADVVGTDASTDLSVLKISDPPDNLQQATLGTSKDLDVGESVMAVGNPLGLDSTVTTGIVSALHRPVATTDEFSREQVVTNAIQIDAAINPGNSGGPLFNASGQVVGITSSIATTSQTSGSIGLGFAIPVDLATDIAAQLIDDGSAEHAFLGVTLTSGVADVDGARRVGAEVHEVVSDAPADRAGISRGDIITEIDGHAVGGAESLTGWVRTYSGGQEATLTLVRDGEQKEVTVTMSTSGTMRS